MLPAQFTDVALLGATSRYGDLSIHGVLDLRRTFSRAELERAAEAAILAFPVLGRRYETRFLRDCWVPVRNPVSEVVRVIDEPDDLEAETRAWVLRGLVVTSAPPFRLVSLRRRGEGSRLIVSVSHMAADGAGVAAVGHVVGAKLYGVAPSAPVDGKRELRSALERLKLLHLPVLARDMAANVVQALRSYPASRWELPRAGSPGAEPAFRQLTIPAADLAALTTRCRRQPGTTINDMLIAALSRVIAERSSRGPVLVLYTMDLRRYALSRRLAATNASAILSVILRRGDVGDLAGTTAAVARITARHRAGLAGPAFALTALALVSGAPHAFIRRVVPPVFRVLLDLPLRRGLLVSNVGRIDEGLAPFAADLEGVRILGPNLKGFAVPVVIAYGFRGALYLELVGASGVGAGALDELAREVRRALELPPEAPSSG